jgi:hypothetical protein
MTWNTQLEGARREDLRSALAVLQALGIPQLASAPGKTLGQP